LLKKLENSVRRIQNNFNSILKKYTTISKKVKQTEVLGNIGSLSHRQSILLEKSND